MNTIQVDAATAELLKKAQPGAEVVGPDGETLAAVLPPDLLAGVRRTMELRRRLLEEDDVTLEELKAADAAGGEYTMEDVLKLLEKYK